MSDKNDLYLAPEFYEKLRSKNKELKYDQQKNDSFALGMVLL